MINLTKKLVEREVEVKKMEMQQVPVWVDSDTGREYDRDALKNKILDDLETDGDNALNHIASSHCCHTKTQTLLHRTSGQDYLEIYKAIKPHITLLKETDLI